MTPSEWLLAKFDENAAEIEQHGRGFRYRIPGPHVARPMFDFLPATWGGRPFVWSAAENEPF